MRQAKFMQWPGRFLASLDRRGWRFPLLSLLLCVLAYGLFIPWLGLYWDDWPITWSSYRFGPQIYQTYADYRPASGWVYFFSFSALDESPLGWHLFAFVSRWLSGVAFHWLLTRLWPKGAHLALVAALLFVVYPGFSQQSIAVTYSVYFLYYTLFLCSAGLMVAALQSTQLARARLYTVGALVLGVFSMLCTEYFYGLELLRPALIFLALQPKNAAQWRKTLLAWLPYGVMLVGVFVWRNWASQQSGALYAPVLLTKLAADPLPAFTEWLGKALLDILEGGLLAWGRVGEVWADLRGGSVVSWLYVAVVLAGLTLSAWMLQPARRMQTAQREAPGNPMMALGVLALVVSGISFWIADLPLVLAFPNDRFTMPMMFGASLVVAGVWGRLQSSRVRPIYSKALLVALVGLCVGFHFLTANQYRQEWARQTEFARQLSWRAPELARNTAVVSPELRALRKNTDNSLTGMLNWMYAKPDQWSEAFDYSFFFAELRSQSGLAGLRTQGEIRNTYDFGRYTGTAEDVLILIYEPPACLRVLDPATDAHYPQLSAEVAPLLAFSHPQRIQSEQARFEEHMPFWDLAPRETWCYYFQKADLARQQGDWQTVAQLGQRAFELDDHPNHPAERTPFIEAYAMLGENERALELTATSLQVSAFMQPMLCDVWARVQGNGADPQAVSQAFDLLQCGQ